MTAKSPAAPGRSATRGARQGRGPLDPRKVLTAIREVVYDWDLSSDQIAWGANAAAVLGLRDIATVATGTAFALRSDPADGKTRHEAVLRSQETDAGDGVLYRAAYGFSAGPNARVLIEDSGRWYAGPEGRPVRAHGVLRIDRGGGRNNLPAADMHERASFLDRIREDVAEAGSSRRPLTVMVLALDDLARINDDLGSEAADDLIQEFARRVRTVMRRRDTLARCAGNRFALALRSCPPDQAEVAARRVAEVIRNPPIETAPGPLAMGLRIGAATAPDHAADAAMLLRRAEEALGAAQRTPRRSFVLCGGPATSDFDRRAAPSSSFEVLDALNARRVCFASQPVVEARSRAIAFGEALMRIRTDGRIWSADAILPGIERTGLVPLVDARMLELVADHLAAHPEERLGLNLSAVTLVAPEWPETLAAHLGARPGIASRLVVEITESAVVRDLKAVRGRLDAMKSLSVAVAIDHFGAGHASFRHLRGLPVDLLKIDGAFVQNLTRSPDDRFHVRALIDLARHLGIATVAAWVEDEEAALLLAGWGVDYLQGRHCGAPVLIETPARPAARDAA
jgi:diguanylate cyclase (GGDEF)-like protein